MAPVVDTNVFVRGRNQPFNNALTIPEVMEEIKSEKGKQNFNSVSINVKEPSEKSLEEVQHKSCDINSPTSEVDEKLLALAIDEKTVLITDDKALQNLASHLDLEFQSYMTDEIEQQREWKKVCENCGGLVDDEKCGKCGSTTICRKPS